VQKKDNLSIFYSHTNEMGKTKVCTVVLLKNIIGLEFGDLYPTKKPKKIKISKIILEFSALFYDSKSTANLD
jgi:hypothetical protein